VGWLGPEGYSGAWCLAGVWCLAGAWCLGAAGGLVPRCRWCLGASVPRVPRGCRAVVCARALRWARGLGLELKKLGRVSRGQRAVSWARGLVVAMIRDQQIY
jgi:hypothetical protein